jgi:short-subunit dehydrogenase
VGAFADRYGPWAIVAGASEGIGEHVARQLAAAGVAPVLVSRREALLDALAASIRADTGVAARVVALDLTAPDAADRLAAATADLDVGLLVYNAGADTMARKYLDRTLEEVQHLLALNVATPAALCHAIGRRLRERGRGGIALIGSMAGLAGTGWVATYAATKAFDQVLAEGLWRELRGDGVDVVAVLAGATATPAHERSGARVTEEFPPMDPADVAAEVLGALGNGPVWVVGDANRAMFDALRAAPRVDLIEAMTHGTQLLYGVED